MPRLSVHLAALGTDDPMVRLNPIVDTGADYTLFDGSTALYLGWSERDIVDRALSAQPIWGWMPAATVWWATSIGWHAVSP